MATEVVLPKLGFSINEGMGAEWLMADGGEFAEGQPLDAFKSDKSRQEVVAQTSSALRIVRPVGEILDVSTALAVRH